MTKTSSSERIGNRSEALKSKPLETNFQTLQNRIQDIPNGNTLLAQITKDLSSLPVSIESRKIEDMLLSVDEDMLDLDIINLLQQAIVDIKNIHKDETMEAKTKTMEAKTKKTEEEAKKTEEEAKTTEVKAKTTEVKAEKTKEANTMQ